MNTSTIRSLIMIILISVFSLNMVQAQILIDQNDMPLVNDTFRISSGIPNPLMDPSVTGPNHTWDYSWLVPFAQNIDTFRSVASSGSLYAFFFMNQASNPNRANLVGKGPALPSVPGLAISNVMSFFFNSAASFKQVGIGANINGNNVPIAYNPHDIIYKFPMNFGNVDSSNSAFSLTLPGLGYYGYTLKRHNTVDGWGTLITPYGSFQTLRVKSTMEQRDTLYIDSLSTGFAMDRPFTVEYKWLADNKGVPMLEIITQDGFPGPVVTNISYRDSARVMNTGTVEVDLPKNSFSLYPNPSTGQSFLDIVNARQGDLDIRLMDMQGREIHRFSMPSYPAGQSRLMFDAVSLQLNAGIYFIDARIGNSRETIKWVISAKGQ